MFKKLATNLLSSTRYSQQLTVTGVAQKCLLSTNYPKCEGLVLEQKDDVLYLRFDRPQKYNAITRDMFTALTDTFVEVNSDESVKAVVLTGNGNFYSSGNDLNNLKMALKHPDGLVAGMTVAKNTLKKFVDSLIYLEKFAVAAVNGPAIGIPVSTLPLFDYVISSDKATFKTPFTSIGQCPEACSSVTFPALMGSSKSSELLLLNKTWNTQEAKQFGLVSEVVPHDDFQAKLDELLNGKTGLLGVCYPNALKQSKSLIRNDMVKKNLSEANERECNTILELWLGEECMDAVQKFMSKAKA